MELEQRVEVLEKENVELKRQLEIRHQEDMCIESRLNLIVEAVKQIRKFTYQEARL